MKLDIYDVIYVEDEENDWNALRIAVEQRNKTATSHPLRIKWAHRPEDLDSLLSLSTRLVLADVFFSDSKSIDGDDSPRLDDIIKAVRRWSNNQRSVQFAINNSDPPRLLPIIAYTRRSPAGLEYCLADERRKYLYDIWDKSAASPEYVAWRLSEISKDLSRRKPDALTQRLIREMKEEDGATWHDFVVDMTRRYDEGWSEQDQIQRAGVSIEKIAFKMQVSEVCEPVWTAMVKWEALSRAVSKKTRGHARHVINVFWLGYYLLTHPLLRNLFGSYWDKLKSNRKNMGEVKDVHPIEGLCNSWFYAGLFHDVGGIIEKDFDAAKFQRELTGLFRGVAPVTSIESMTINQYLEGCVNLNQKDETVIEKSKSIVSMSKTQFLERVQPWLNEFDDSLMPLIRPVVEKSIEDNAPDQGVVGALYFRSKIKKGKQECYAREGARAMSMHNLFPKLGDGEGEVPVTWDNEPLVCLLLLCDQLQTWDRERGTDALHDSDQPSRAELSSIEINNDGGLVIKMAIDYVSPVHVDRSFELRERVRDELISILHKNPYRALNRIHKPWPFELRVHCTLSGEHLEDLHFGGV